jgi:hydrogenase-4 component B
MLVAMSAGFAAVSGIPPLLMGGRTPRGQWIATILMIISAICGLSGVASLFITGRAATFSMLDAMPFGPCDFGLDYLSAWFLLPVIIVSTCCSIYGTRYWAADANPKTWRRLTFFFGILTAAIVILIGARNGILFLVAWEVMALSAYFVLTTEDHKQDVQDAGLLYIIATHTGTLALFALFSLLEYAASSYQFSAMASINTSPQIAAAIFCTALFGFGLKAGLMPLHIWLPSAHASAPSHISAIMSGIMIKTGVYGMIRILSFFPHPPLWWGITLLIVGIISAVMGVVFALGQHDLKRLLAYHSIENIGIIFMGIGLAVIGQATAQPLLATLGMAGALLHTVNHALFKSLLFLGAGSVIHVSHTREIDQMGGLAKSMPWTSALFLLGAVAICGLPPLNGFVSEYLIYLGIFNGVIGGDGPAAPVMALAAPALAMVGALAVACFVKVCGITFLGTPRTSGTGNAHEAGWPMRLPMAVLAFFCAIIGLFPKLAALSLQPAVSVSLQKTAWMPGSAAPLGWITVLGLVLVTMGIYLAWNLWRKNRKTAARSVTWGCGYLRPTPRMQYSSSSFAEMIVKLFSGLLRPHGHKPEIVGSVPVKSGFNSHVPEAVLELVIIPLFAAVDQRFNRIRKLQHGQLPLYILYIFICLCLLLTWAV